MNTNYLSVISASLEDRKDLFLAASNRLGTTLQNIEKDFWVCVVLDMIFNDRLTKEPRCLFKGGTSLSKGYGLISRFSEDVDITFFRQDLGLEIDFSELKKLSRNQQTKKLEQLKAKAQSYINGEFKKRLNEKLDTFFSLKNFLTITEDPMDPLNQTLLVHYPSVMHVQESYIQPVVKIEAGARSALEPYSYMTISPYISSEMNLDLSISNVAIINAERTFWDKVIILHGLCAWYKMRGEVKQNGNRVSRHYYDVYQFMHSSIGKSAVMNKTLATDCAQHAILFFNSADLNLEQAKPGSFTLLPTQKMQTILKRDYQAMSGMIFGDVPKFDEIIEVIASLEELINTF